MLALIANMDLSSMTMTFLSAHFLPSKANVHTQAFPRAATGPSWQLSQLPAFPAASRLSCQPSQLPAVVAASHPSCQPSLLTAFPAASCSS